MPDSVEIQEAEARAEAWKDAYLRAVQRTHRYQDDLFRFELALRESRQEVVRLKEIIRRVQVRARSALQLNEVFAEAHRTLRKP